jgi:hypothetical protein
MIKIFPYYNSLLKIDYDFVAVAIKWRKSVVGMGVMTVE